MTDLPSQPKAISSSLRDIYAYILGDAWGRKIPPTFVVLGGELILVDLAQGRGNPLEMNIQDDEQDKKNCPRSCGGWGQEEYQPGNPQYLVRFNSNITRRKGKGDCSKNKKIIINYQTKSKISWRIK
jgi:hypothetical protein